MECSPIIIAAGALCIASVAAARSFDVIHAKRTGTYRSIDKLYVATLKIGEGEAGELKVFNADNLKERPIMSETDVTGLIWDPGMRHRLIYSESAIYGDGKIVVWDGLKLRTIYRGNEVIEDLRWDRTSHQLQFKVLDLNQDGNVWKQKRIKFK